MATTDPNKVKPSRVETILMAMLGESVEINEPKSRVEELLLQLKEAIEQGGGSGFTPTQEQLDAMNSGIDDIKVAQIDTNENNILSLIDTGAKNMIDIDTTVIETAGFVIPADTPFVHGAGEYTISFSSTNAIAIGANIVFDNDNSEILRQNITINAGDNVQTFTLPSAVKKVRWYITGATTISNLMICTAAAYNTSSAYEPYCPTLAEVYAMVKALQT